MLILFNTFFVLALISTIAAYIKMHSYNLSQNVSTESYNLWQEGKCTLEQYRLKLLQSDNKRVRYFSIYKTLEFVSITIGILIFSSNLIHKAMPMGSSHITIFVMIIEIVSLTIYFNEVVSKKISNHREFLKKIREDYSCKLSECK